MANTQYQQLDNNLNFKFVWLNSGNLVHLQSRGLSLEVCGYLPISLGNQPNQLRDLINSEDNTLLNLGAELVNYRESDGNSKLLDCKNMTFIFPGMNYNTNGKYVLRPSTPEYKEWLVDFSNHLFKDIRALNTAEMKFVNEDLDNKFESQNQTAAAGSIQLSFDIKNETFGTYIHNNFYIDAVMIFGQAYNDRAFKDLTREEQIQRIVPIGLLIYADDRELDGNSEAKQRPFIQPGKMNGVVVRETLVITLAQGNLKITAIEDDENFKQWRDFAGRMHLVNDNLSTSAKFFLVDNNVSKGEIETNTADIEGLSADGRTFAMRDRLYMADFDNNWDDANDDFASPAMITCMTSAQGGYKNPQLILSQVSKNTIKETGNIWDGVAHSYWTENIDLADKSLNGSMYNVDWISTKRPGINLFCSDLKHAYIDEYRKENPTESASFGGGFNMMTTRSYASRNATNLFGNDNYLRGDALALGSQYVHYYQSGFNAEALESERKKNNGSTGNMFINSEYLDIKSYGGGVDNLTTIAADNIWLYGTGDNVNKKRRVTLVNAEYQQIIDSNRVLMLNVKGKKQDGEWISGGVSRVTNSLVANGCNTMTSVDKGLIIGDRNAMIGASVDKMAHQCQIFGSNNRVDSVNTTYGEAKYVTVIGHGLNYDPKQHIFERTANPCKTIILGQDNNVYTQLDLINNLTTRSTTIMSKKGVKGNKGAKGKKGLKNVNSATLRSFKTTDYTNKNIYPVAIKQIVIGGWKPTTNRHKIQKYNMAEFSVDNTTLNDSIMTLMDIKGRAIDYTSRGVNVAVQQTHTQDAYDNYDYTQIGGINWGKLIHLLNHLEYDPETNIVKYNTGRNLGTDPQNQCGYYDTLNNSRCLYDLVRNDVGVGPLPLNFRNQ